MVRRGIDPEAAPALLKYEAEAKREAELVGFVDTPELRAADTAFRAAHPEEDDLDHEGDPREWVRAELNRIAARFRDGSSPDFAHCSMSQLWAWALAQEWRAEDSVAGNAIPAP